MFASGETGLRAEMVRVLKSSERANVNTSQAPKGNNALLRRALNHATTLKRIPTTPHAQ
jgi:hypothetical protein